MQNFVIIQKSSLRSLAKAVIGTRSLVLLRLKSLIQKSPQKHQDYYTRLSVAGGFCTSESQVPLL